LQDALRSRLEASIIPAFEMSCKAMFDQVDATFQNGLNKHINDIQQQFNSMHSPVAIALRVCVLLICIVVGCRSSIFMCFCALFITRQLCILLCGISS
jgi:hypothetical protein